MFLFLESISKHPLHVLWPPGGPDPNFGNLWSRWCPAEMIEDFKIEWALLLYPFINIIKMFNGVQLHHYLYSHIQQEVGVAFTESSPHCCTTVRPIVQNKT